MKITEPGIYPFVESVYHADDVCGEPSLSASGAIKLTATCPAIYWYERNHPPEPSEAFDVGTAAHEWLLEGDKWPQRHHVLPEDHNGRTNAGKALVESIVADGKRPITLDQFTTIKGMVAALKAHPFAYAAFQNGKAEQSLFWRDDELGIWCRARPDFLPDERPIIADYKTCRSAHPDDIKRSMHSYGYFQQAEWYTRGVKALGLIAEPRFLFVFQQKTPPYLITCVTPEANALAWAEIVNRKARETFARCLRSGVWPGFADEIVALDLPAWAESQLQQKHAAGAFSAEPMEAA